MQPLQYASMPQPLSYVLPVSGFALLHGTLSFADTAADKQIFNTGHDFLLPSGLRAFSGNSGSGSQ